MTVRRAAIWIIVLVLVGGAALLGLQGIRAARQFRLALADYRSLVGLAKSPSAEALPALRTSASALDQHLQAGREAARPFLAVLPAFGWLPGVGPTARQVPALLTMAAETAGGLHQALDALGPALDLLGRPGKGDLLAEATVELASAAPGLAAADARLAHAQAARGDIHGPLNPAVASLLSRFDRTLPLASAGLQLAQAAPDLLGAKGPRSYLVLAQNSHELRATGGFISGAGVLQVDHGRITGLKLTDSYAVDNLQQPHPDPPAALAAQMGMEILLLRDSNWSPDFVTSAQIARAIYQQDQGTRTDGAIALDLEAVRLLVGALGPLQVPGVTGDLTGENVIQKMEEAWASPASGQGTTQIGTADWWTRRKDFMGPMVAAALVKLQTGTGINPAALGSALMEMLNGRHLQIALDDPDPARVMAGRNWDGALRPPAPGEGDFLAVVDSNVGYNKVNAAVKQEISYRERLAGDQVGASLTMTYTHTAQPLPPDQACVRTAHYGDSYEEMIRRCYWDYLRVYAPGGSELTSVEGLENVSTEAGERGTAVFAGNLTLRPGDQQVVTLHYRLPAAKAGAPSHLIVRKQGGTLAPRLEVAIGDCHWETDLSRDRAFRCPAGP
jgi:hypothetical protein